MAEMKGQRLARLLGGDGNVPLAQQRAMERLRMGREAQTNQSNLISQQRAMMSGPRDAVGAIINPRYDPIKAQAALRGEPSLRVTQMGQLPPQAATSALAAPAGDTFGGQMIMPGQGGYYTDTTQQNFVPTPPVRRLPPQLPRVASEVGQYTPPVAQMPTMRQGAGGYIPDETGQMRPQQTITPTMQPAPRVASEVGQFTPPQTMTPTAQRAPMISNAARSPFGRAMAGGTGKSSAAPPRPRATGLSGSSGMTNQAAY